MTGGLGQEARGGEHGGQADGDVEEEPDAPGQRLGQHAADDQPGGGADAGQRSVGRHRPRALLAFGKARRQQRQGGGRQRGGAHALHGACGDHGDLGLREPDAQRRDGEQADAGDERPSSAEQVADARAEQQQAAEGQGVGVLHPGQAGRRQAQLAMDARQRGHQDRDVDEDQQVAGEDDRQHHAAGLAGRRGHRSVATRRGSCAAPMASSCSGVQAVSVTA
jgi:hypothetical protein